MRHICAALTLVLGAWPAASAAEKPALTAVEQSDPKGRKTVRLQNEHLRLTVAPADGGRVTALETTDGAFRVPAGARLLGDAFTRRAIEQPPAGPAYACRIVRQPRDRVGVELETRLAAPWAGPASEGMTLVRRITLRAGARHVEVAQVLVNTAAHTRSSRIGVANILFLGQPKGSDALFLPTERHVLRLVRGRIDDYYARTSDWEHGPAAGWTAVVNERTGQGLAFVMNSARLDCFYARNATGALGWFVDGGVLAPGKRLTTTYTLLPIEGFRAVAHASRRLIANVDAARGPDGVRLTHVLACGVKPLEQVRVKTSVYGVESKRTVDLPTVDLGQVGRRPVTGQVKMPGARAEALVVRAQIEGKGWRESYEVLREGLHRAAPGPGFPWNPKHRRASNGR